MSRFWALMVTACLAVALCWALVVVPDFKENLDSLFGGLAFVGLIGNLIFQSKQIKDSQEAAELERKALIHAALLQGYTALLDYHQRRDADQLRFPSPEERAEHAAMMRHAAMRIRDFVKHLLRSTL